LGTAQEGGAGVADGGWKGQGEALSLFPSFVLALESARFFARVGSNSVKYTGWRWRRGKEAILENREGPKAPSTRSKVAEEASAAAGRLCKPVGARARRGSGDGADFSLERALSLSLPLPLTNHASEEVLQKKRRPRARRQTTSKEAQRAKHKKHALLLLLSPARL
jgi:hypothetical protein